MQKNWIELKTSDVIKTFFKTKTKPSVQDEDQDLFVMYIRGRPKTKRK